MSYDLERSFHLASRPGRRTGGRRNTVQAGVEPAPPPAADQPLAEDRPHPLARRMALAIECKRLIESGVVADAAAMARIAGVTRARMTQILNLNLLAPDVQERLLFVTKSVKGFGELGRLSLLWETQRSTLPGAFTKRVH